MSQTRCQRCLTTRNDSWNVHQCEFHVGRVEHWKIQLCPDCADLLEQVILNALKSARPEPERPA